MDYFNRLILHVQQQGKIKGVCFSNESNLTHLLFDDDILLFVEDNDEYITNFRNIIFLFEAASGLNFNLSKSTISPINVDNCRTDVVCNLWGLK